MYFKGRGVDQDFSKSRNWSERSAEDGMVDSQIRLAQIYQYGLGVDTNLSDALEWYQRAAAQGNPVAQYNVGALLASTSEELSQAVNWYSRSAEQGNVDAQVELGDIYSTGLLGRVDNVEAAIWYRKAAQQNNAKAQYQLAALLGGVPGIQPNPDEAFTLYGQSARQGICRANQGWVKPI